MQGLFRLFHQEPDDLQFMGRSLVSRLVVLSQAVLLKRYAPDFIANAFIATRYQKFHGQVVGMLDPKQVDVTSILNRAFAA